MFFGVGVSLLMTLGSASNDMSWVTAGVLLLVISVLCSWDFLWYLDMNLATFGALFHGALTGLSGDSWISQGFRMTTCTP